MYRESINSVFLEKVLWLITKEKLKFCFISKDKVADSLNGHGRVTSMEYNLKSEKYCLIQKNKGTMNA